MTPSALLVPLRRLPRLLGALALMASTVGLLALVPGCSDPGSNMPGTSLGSFSMVGAIATNSCGTALGADNPWKFSLQLSKDGATLYLQSAQETAPISGAIDATNKATLSRTRSATNERGCSVQRVDTTVIDLGTDAAPASITGTLSMAYSVSSVNSGDCSSELASNGGHYDGLPCTLNYTLTGTKK